MNKLITSMFLLAASIMAISFASAYFANQNFASATSNNNLYQVLPISGNNQFLMNCLSDNGGNGETQRYEPLGCSLDVDNISFDQNPAVEGYLYTGDGRYIEDPDQFGWD